MEPAEVLHRAGELRRKAVSRRWKNGWHCHPAGEVLTVFRNLKERVSKASPEQRQAIANAAEKALSGRFAALGASWPQRSPSALYPDELWRFDPITGGKWPGAETYTFDIDYRHAGDRGDIKYVWEIGRLQQLPVLATYAFLTGDRAAIIAIEAAIESWHRVNPPFRGVGWASGIEVALRSISLIVAHDLVSDRMSVECRKCIGEILAASDYWLRRFPSRFSSANNHLVAELAGEYLIRLALGRSVRHAKEELAAETMKQILPDGCGAEQSPTYAAFTAEFILLCMLAAAERGQSMGVAVKERLAAFADFIEWMPERASFGDDDEGRVITLGEETDYASSVASAVRGFLGQPGRVSESGDYRSLLFGRPAGEIASREGLRVFREGGISIWRGDLGGRRAELTFDHGPLGYLSIAAHGHADALSLTLRLDGAPVLVDPGTWLYGSGGTWRSWFRSTPAHNTLNIAGESQSVMSGAFNWSHKASAKLIGIDAEPDWSVTAEHDGYRRRFGVIHRRAVRRAGDAIVVDDRLIGGTHDAENVFQLAAALAVDISGATARVSRGERGLLEIQFPPGEISIETGVERPGEGGWISPRFGKKIPAPRLTWRGKVEEKGVETILQPLSGFRTRI